MPQSDDRPLVTFFVMAYRQAHVVREAIESAFAQTWAPLEIVLSDDASGDGTFEAMQEMAAAYAGPHRVVLNRNPVNLGIARHLDRIMEISSGRLIVQNAGDDVSSPERTDRLARAWIASEGRAALLHSPARIIDAEGAERGLKSASWTYPAGASPLGLIRRDAYVLGAASAWDRRLWEVFGPLGGDIGVEDSVLPVRAAALGEIGFVPEPLVKWRAGGLSWAERSELRGRDYLFGARVDVLRWRAASHRRIQLDLVQADIPDRDACLEASRARSDLLEFEVALADASGPGARTALLPRALRLARRRRSRAPLAQWIKYVLHPLYARWLDLRYPPGELRW